MFFSIKIDANIHKMIMEKAKKYYFNTEFINTFTQPICR